MPSSFASALLLILVLSLCLGATTKPTQTKRQPIRVRQPSKPLLLNDLSSKDILIVLAGTVSRPEQTAAQQSTFGLHFPTALVTEAHAHSCVFCGNADGTESHRGTFFDDRHDPRFDGRPVGWYCARKLQYLALVLEQLDWAPEAVIILDDDTFVHPLAALSLLGQPHARRGARIYGSAFEGGAGYILNKAALERLRSEAPVSNMVWDEASSAWTKAGAQTFLDTCLHRGLGGSWCYMHDDHLFGACADAAGVEMRKLDNMHMLCRVGNWHQSLHPPSAWLGNSSVTAWVRSEVLTCHYTDPETMQSMYGVIVDEQFKSLVVPASKPGLFK